MLLEQRQFVHPAVQCCASLLRFVRVLDEFIQVMRSYGDIEVIRDKWHARGGAVLGDVIERYAETKRMC